MKIHPRLEHLHHLARRCEECEAHGAHGVCREDGQCINFVSCGGNKCNNPCPKCLFWTGYGIDEDCVQDLIARLERQYEQ